jgi:alcohol dehydrogenase (cytochrome c)
MIIKQSIEACAKKLRRSVSVVAAISMAMTGGHALADLAGSGDWAQYHNDYRGWRYSELDQVNKKTVKNLKVAWMHQSGDIRHGLHATPLVIDGTIYYSGSSNRVFALNAATGEEIWHYYAELDPIHEKSIFSFFNRGVTVGRGKVFVGTSDGRIIALDQKTGREQWTAKLLEPKNCHGCNFTSPPQLAGDILIGGHTGGDHAQRGKIYAVKADTGEVAWVFDTIRDDPASWPADAAKTGGGGAWLPGQYDPKHDLFFIGTSNAAPDFDNTARPGDNLYTASILALRPSTGELVWHHQEVPADSWDFDSPYEFVFLEQDGRDLMIHLNKGGYVTVLDRKTGKIANVWPLAEHINWVKGVDPRNGALQGRVDPLPGKSMTFCPSVLGARSWNPGAYSPKQRLWYTNAVEACNRVTMESQVVADLAFSQPYFGVAEFEVIAPPSGKGASRLGAYDPLTGKLAWKVEYDLPGLGGVLATGGGLVFNGDSHGWVHAYDDQNGKELWKFNTGSGIRGGIVSYSAGGKQYILVPSGFGSLFPGFSSSLWPEFRNIRGGSTLIAFTVE